MLKEIESIMIFTRLLYLLELVLLTLVEEFKSIDISKGSTTAKSLGKFLILSLIILASLTVEGAKF